ncbi:MAG: hypothetical protein ACYDHH_04120 [Solirubrobacteraceae bacterium]
MIRSPAPDSDGATGSASASYTVSAGTIAGQPTVAIASPVNGVTYGQGQVVAAAYACAAPAGATVSSCACPVANGAPIDTASLGAHTFTVTARDSDGAIASAGAAYVVAAAAGAPVLSAASETAKMWRENDSLARITAKSRPPVGTTFTFALNEPATVTLAFTAQTAGRKLHHRCVAAAGNSRHRPRCTRASPAGSLTFTGHPGTNTIQFAGRISPTNKLKRGGYTLQITATNSQNQHSATQSLTFTIVK